MVDKRSALLGTSEKMRTYLVAECVRESLCLVRMPRLLVVQRCAGNGGGTEQSDTEY